MRRDAVRRDAVRRDAVRRDAVRLGAASEWGDPHPNAVADDADLAAARRSCVRRGELRGYTRPATPQQSRTVAILSDDGITDSARPWLLRIELSERDPVDLLATPVADRGRA